MNVLKGINRDNNYNKICIFFLLNIALIFLHLHITKTNDDIGFTHITNQLSIYDFLITRYKTWSSRVLIEGAIWYLVKHYYLWKLLDIILINCIYIFMIKLFSDNKRTSVFFIAFICILIYPFGKEMSSAGYLATTVNYLWPLSCIIITFYGVKKSCNRLKLSLMEYFIYNICLIYACWSEQGNIFLLSGLIVAFFYCFYKKHFNIYILIQIIEAILILVFILYSPGTDSRFNSEIRLFPDYLMLSFVDKLQLSFATTLSPILFKPRLEFLIFAFLVLTVVMLKHKCLLYRVIASIPLCSTLIFGTANITQYGFLYYISRAGSFASNANSIIKINNSENLILYFLIILLGICFLCILCSVYLCFYETPTKALSLVTLIFIGFLSRMPMGFSPTVWASDTRTFTFFTFSFIICIFVFFEYLIEINYKNLNYFMGIFTVLGFAVYLSNLLRFLSY